MREVFAVFQQGIYRHGCFGIFSSKDKAIAHADHLAGNDKDDYHEYHVVPFTTNKPMELQADKPIYRVKRGRKA